MSIRSFYAPSSSSTQPEPEHPEPEHVTTNGSLILHTAPEPEPKHDAEPEPQHESEHVRADVNPYFQQCRLLKQICAIRCLMNG